MISVVRPRPALRALFGTLALVALLAGCAMPTLPEPPEHMRPRTEDIELGQTFRETRTDRHMTIFRFRAQTGTPVTITVRSEAGHPLSLDVYNGVYAFGRQMLIPIASDSGRAWDPKTRQLVPNAHPNGPHAEVMGVLPANKPGEYSFTVSSVEMGALLKPFSVTLSPGLVPAADILTVPEPVAGSAGQFMSPFTEDNTVAPWVRKGAAAGVVANVGSAIGSMAASSSDNVFLALAGAVIGEVAGKGLAIEAMGGWETIKAESDLSFNSMRDMAIYLHANNAGHRDYQRVLQATYLLYPELQQELAQLSPRF